MIKANVNADTIVELAEKVAELGEQFDDMGSKPYYSDTKREAMMAVGSELARLSDEIDELATAYAEEMNSENN